MPTSECLTYPARLKQRGQGIAPRQQEYRLCAGPRGHAPDTGMDDGGVLIPVNVPVGLGQLGGVGRQRLFLRDGRGGIAVGVLPEHFHHETPAEIGQFVVHGGGGVVDADAERALLAATDEAAARVEDALAADDYAAALAALAALRAPIDAFFEDVLIMDDDLALRENRLRLLNRFVAVFAHVADFGKMAKGAK